MKGDLPEIAAVNDAVGKLLAWHGRKTNFDALKRHGRNEWMRMFEACKVLSAIIDYIVTLNVTLMTTHADVDWFIQHREVTL
jgi:hypothetical protein